MARTIKSVIASLMNNPLSVDPHYKNQVAINGFIIKKPTITLHEKSGIESCSFALYQIVNGNNVSKIDDYNCMTFDKDLIAQIKEQKDVLYVGIEGQLRYSKRIKSLYIHVMKMKTIAETKLPFATEWKEQVWNTLEQKTIFMK